MRTTIKMVCSHRTEWCFKRYILRMFGKQQCGFFSPSFISFCFYPWIILYEILFCVRGVYSITWMKLYACLYLVLSFGLSKKCVYEIFFIITSIINDTRVAFFEYFADCALKLVAYHLNPFSVWWKFIQWHTIDLDKNELEWLLFLLEAKTIWYDLRTGTGLRTNNNSNPIPQSCLNLIVPLCHCVWVLNQTLEIC